MSPQKTWIVRMYMYVCNMSDCLFSGILPIQHSQIHIHNIHTSKGQMLSTPAGQPATNNSQQSVVSSQQSAVNWPKHKGTKNYYNASKKSSRNNNGIMFHKLFMSTLWRALATHTQVNKLPLLRTNLFELAMELPRPSRADRNL